MNNGTQCTNERVKKQVTALSSMSLLFYRTTLAAGGSVEEAKQLTQAYMAAFMFGQPVPQMEAHHARK